MKKFKYILSAFLIALCFCMPCALTGCAKHYKAQVTIVEGLGDVRRSLGNTNEQFISLVGETDVEKGKNFKYTVGTSYSDYEIWYIVENEKVIYDVTEPDLYDKTLDSQGQYTGNISNVNGNISIRIAFRLKLYAMEFYYWNSQTNSYEALQHNGSTYKLVGNNEQYKTIYGMGAFGWLIKNDKDVLVTFTIPDEFTLRRNYKLYAPKDKSVDDLRDLLGISNTPENEI